MQPWSHPDPIMVSFSSMSTLDTCARRYEFFKLYSHGKRSLNIEGDVGIALHRGWQSWLITKNQDAAMRDMMMAYPIRDCTATDHDRSLEAAYATLLCMMNSVSLVQYQIVEVHKLDGTQAPAIELEFEIWLDGFTIRDRPVVYRGFIDVLLFDVLTGQYVAGDLKTHRRNKAVDMTAEYFFHGQAMPYGLVIQQLAGGDVLNFDVFYISAYIDILEPKVTPYIIPKAVGDVKDWYFGLHDKLWKLKKHYETGYFPRRERGCLFYNKPCQFMGICNQRNPEIIQTMLLMPGEAEQKKMPRNPWVQLVLPMPEKLDLAA